MNERLDVGDQNSPCIIIEKNWLIRIFCSICLIIILLIFLISAISLNQNLVKFTATQNFNRTETLGKSQVSPEFPLFEINHRKLTFEQLFSGKKIFEEEYDFTWLNDGSFVYDEHGFFSSPSANFKVSPFSFVKENYTNGIELSKRFSADGLYKFQTKFAKTIFRHSSESVYIITNLTNSSGLSPQYWPVGPVENASIQGFFWCPSLHRHDFVYLHNYNLYYQQDPEHPEEAVQLTSDGSFFNRIGVTNWLYEEEILESGTAVWWSPSGRYISYLKFDDRKVNRIFLPKNTVGKIYPEYNELPYPKAGVTNNTLVSQFIWDKDTEKIVETAPPNELLISNGNYYVLQNKWIKIPSALKELGQERLVTVWSTRDQNQIYFSLCNETDCIMTFSQTFKIGSRELWVEPKEVGCIHETKHGFLTILPHEYADGNIYNHVAHIVLQSSGAGRIVKWIGNNFDVLTILGYNIDNDILMFSGLGKTVGNKNVYKVSEALKTENKNTEIENVNNFIDRCENSEIFSLDPTSERLMMQCQQPFENTKLYLLNVKNVSENSLLAGEKNALFFFEKPILEFGTVKLPSGIDGHYMIMVPPNLVIGKKIPLLVDIYGGPNTKKVSNKTPSLHSIQLCSQLEIAIVNLDVRGTSGRGWNVKEAVYKKLGKAETDDTINIIKEIINRKTFIDAEKISIMGWSYGGFLASKIATIDQGDVFKCAIAIAPVTNFRLYDTAYTERFLGLPSVNPNGYDQTNLILHAVNITNVKYFLAHGEQDDNVHYQNSAIWSEALQINNIHFTQLVYSNEAHSMKGKIQHLFSEIQHFLTADCFNF